MTNYTKDRLRGYICLFNEGKRANDYYKMDRARNMVCGGTSMALDMEIMDVYYAWRKIEKMMDNYIFNYVLSK